MKETDTATEINDVITEIFALNLGCLMLIHIICEDGMVISIFITSLIVNNFNCYFTFGISSNKINCIYFYILIVEILNFLVNKFINQNLLI